MTLNNDELEHDINTLSGEMELEDYMEQREQELRLKIAQEKYETEEMEEICETCSYYYHDGFCTYHLSYWSPDHTCPKWTDEELELDYDFLYRRCQDYIRICEMYNHYEKLKKENPDAIIVKAGTSNEDFFLQCCLNDMKRELSLWTLKK